MELKNADKTIDKLKGFAVDIPLILNEALDNLALASVQIARSEAPSRSGFLRSSIDYRIDGRYVRTLFAAAHYAEIVEKGSKPHMIEATEARALRFVVGGFPVFAKRVSHPGTSARPFMAPAARWVRENAGEVVAAAVRRELRG